VGRRRVSGKQVSGGRGVLDLEKKEGWGGCFFCSRVTIARKNGKQTCCLFSEEGKKV